MNKVAVKYKGRRYKGQSTAYVQSTPTRHCWELLGFKAHSRVGYAPDFARFAIRMGAMQGTV